MAGFKLGQPLPRVSASYLVVKESRIWRRSGLWSAVRLEGPQTTTGNKDMAYKFKLGQPLPRVSASYLIVKEKRREAFCSI